MIHIALCDDNVIFLESLSQCITSIMEGRYEVHITKCANARQLLAQSPQDIIFLDIEMEGMDGMQAAKQLRQRGDPCRLVFLTSYPKYVFSAFDVEASHFLVKPVDTQKLRAVLYKLADKISGEAVRYLTVRNGAGLYRVPLSGIGYLEVIDRKVFVHVGKETFGFYGKLAQVEKEFPEDFFRCHRSYIVHFAHISRYDNKEITLANGDRIPVAKRKYQDFCIAFLHYLKKDGETL